MEALVFHVHIVQMWAVVCLPMIILFIAQIALTESGKSIVRLLGQRRKHK